MEILEAKKIFEAFRKWYWPCHFILDTVFFGKKPESFLPFPKDVITEALSIMEKYYHDIGNTKIADSIQTSNTVMYMSYTKDEEALEDALKWFSNPKLVEATKFKIEKFKKELEEFKKK